METAPTFAKAKAVAAWLGTAGHLYGRLSIADVPDEFLASAFQAMDLEPTDPEVVAYAGYTTGFYEGPPERCLDRAEQATARCPRFAWAWAASSMLSAFAGNPMMQSNAARLR